MAYTILIIAKEPMLTDVLSEHLTHNGYRTCTANNSPQALEQLQRKPDLILLDTDMSTADPLAFYRQICDHVACPILFLADQNKITGFQADGKADYLAKPFRLHELITCIAAHLPHPQQTQQPSEAVACEGLRVDRTNRTVLYNGEKLSFSKREFDLMEFLQSHADQVFDRERLYEAVWGCDAEGNSSTVKEHIRKIRAKLKAATGQDYIETVWGVGYKWKG